VTRLVSFARARSAPAQASSGPDIADQAAIDLLFGGKR
jgi:hypothetical protein